MNEIFYISCEWHLKHKNEKVPGCYQSICPIPWPKRISCNNGIVSLDWISNIIYKKDLKRNI